MAAYPRDPIFILDSEEDYRPIAVESVEEVPATLIRADGKSEGIVRLEALPGDGGWMDFPAHPRPFDRRGPVAAIAGLPRGSLEGAPSLPQQGCSPALKKG